jgi:hypothetical protein
VVDMRVDAGDDASEAAQGREPMAEPHPIGTEEWRTK